MTKSIMIQGTMSNVGKSLICAGLCRIFRQDGYISAPFKSQNMALNSYITHDGFEIGRAQAMQAESAMIEPSVFMNPILLKPTTERGSQVIVNGRVLGNMQAKEYFRQKKNFIPTIKNAYKKLAEQADIIVIEGAGSPVEMNLKADDIVNMGMAEIADSPVILVGDIDRGGIFAQLIGTLSLLEDCERQRVKGIIVNKFRGDPELFNDGIKILEERTGLSVLGIVPYINCHIDDEDSLSDTLMNKSYGIINIAVVKLPKISNYTDFEPFREYSGVAVRYIEKISELGEPDMIIIPGSKSTISDMKWLRESGFEAVIKKKAEYGTYVFGICGGYQMLGKSIADPENTECGGEIRGMELLDICTVFHSEKFQRRSSGKIIADGDFFHDLQNTNITGYEIHMGETTGNELPFISFSDGHTDGAYKKNVFGTYFHGIFDNTEVSSSIIRKLFHKKGLQLNEKIDQKKYKELQYNLLADTIRNSLNIKKIYNIINH